MSRKSPAGPCHACDRPGHKAFFCHDGTAPQPPYENSGHKAFAELPRNSHTYDFLKTARSDAICTILDELPENLHPKDLKPVLTDLIGKAFACGWRYCCRKKAYNGYSHRFMEPNVLNPNTTATATTESDSDWENDKSNDADEQQSCPSEPDGQMHSPDTNLQPDQPDFPGYGSY